MMVGWFPCIVLICFLQRHNIGIGLGVLTVADVWLHLPVILKTIPCVHYRHYSKHQYAQR